MSIFKDAVGTVTSWGDEASRWMSERAQEAREGISDAYDGITAAATDRLLEATPEPLREGVAAISAGSKKIGGQVLDFLDPVGYALDTGASVVQTAVDSPIRATNALRKIAHGDPSGFTDWGKNYADQLLTEAQVLTLLPAGHIAGKAAKVPIKTARKSLKTAKKAAPKGSVERKALKQDLRRNTQKRIAGVRLAHESAQLAEQMAQDTIVDSRARLGVRTKVKLPQRDWGKLGLQAPSSVIHDGRPVKRR